MILSASSVDAYDRCHLRWWFSYVLADDGETSERQETGSLIHLQAEAALKGDPPPPLDASLRPLLDVFINDIAPTYRDPVLVEASFALDVEGITYTGIIDAVDRHDVPWGQELIVRDLKTTASRPRAGKYRNNMIGYWLGASALGYAAQGIQLDWIVRTRTPYYWPESQPVPELEEIELWAGNLTRIAASIEAGDFEPTGLPRACNGCPHTARCGPYQRYQEAIA